MALFCIFITCDNLYLGCNDNTPSYRCWENECIPCGKCLKTFVAKRIHCENAVLIEQCWLAIVHSIANSVKSSSLRRTHLLKFLPETNSSIQNLHGTGAGLTDTSVKRQNIINRDTDNILFSNKILASFFWIRKFSFYFCSVIRITFQGANSLFIYLFIYLLLCQ